MICAIMQPTYIPWIGYFDMIDKVDIFVVYDDVQLSKRSWQVRNRIKGSSGEIWLTIPIKKTKKREDLLIKDASPNEDENWRQKHLKTIEFNYKKSPHFQEVFNFLIKFYNNNYNLSTFNSLLITNISKKIGIQTKFIFASGLNNILGQKDHRLVNICKEINATEYLSPQGSAEYINEKNKGGEFVNNNIELFYHDYEHPIYPQLYGKFIPYMGIYDLLFNVGFDNALEIIQKGRKENIYYTDLAYENK